ncbi:hypothetical protein TVAG_136400 [Trichomonas vaginalis G3]|uniref:Uncharacterized protein n=1 Tax=Trichomonas vaginalis (strain ATCC PRA-98 / G3) TaxID=412133 RepID=A2DJC2_TRIV3|nr:hypothetical protein TVAGG3_0543540 [Trichomonas vaginalis G3]EAY19509.1 hypothetical protein TVAG_136400 [Trichomonas vaginalis G3]KAI5520009.1 hypothetical protein TVAGG3_0543540 [Trichomonas vaginalis G3]|eukprot:XP_001580495.1 hypothetical protein [Trichomonas vaginalis G3]
MDSLEDYGDSSLIELYNQEKELTERMRSELFHLQQEVETKEREREKIEEGELNEINKRLVRLKCENHILQLRAKHEEKTNDAILSKNLSVIKRERNILSEYSQDMEKFSRIQRETILDSINQLVQKCQKLMSENALTDEVIKETTESLTKYFKNHQESMNDEAKKIDQKIEQETKENIELQKSIELVSAGINTNRRRTSIGVDTQFGGSNLNAIRRHSEIMPISLRLRQNQVHLRK